MSHISSDIAFTPAVKDIQSRRGSCKIYEKVEARGGFETVITEDLIPLLAFVGSVANFPGSLGSGLERHPPISR
jgi:hypothetical protein